jgi:hypothetical protein
VIDLGEKEKLRAKISRATNNEKKNRSIKQVETNSRKTTRREEKLMIGSAKRGEIGKLQT